MQFDLLNPNIDTGATFSPCRKYRYTLWRQWADPADKGTMLALMLNPSTADEVANDPTVERVERRARAMGFGRLIVCNIFAFRATDPAEMKAQADPVGPENDAAILEASRQADLVLCAWGTHGSHMGRSSQIRDLLKQSGCTPYCLTTTSGGEPGHPLYIPYNTKPEPWEF